MVVVAEYIWLDAKKRLRSKTKVIHNINYQIWSQIVNLPAQELADKFRSGTMTVVQQDRQKGYIVS